MTMPHITAQMRSKKLTHDDGRARISKMMAEVPDSIGNGSLRTQEQQQSSPGVIDASSPSIVSNPSPRKRKFNILLTPSSITSAVFDTPLKQSPSSSLSSAGETQPFTVIKRDHTPVAELEDTSRASFFRFELEDTSRLAMSSCNRKRASTTLRSSHPTSQALVIAVDRQFADFEEEIRQLRRDFVRKEQLVAAAQKATAEAQDALLTAEKAVAEREAVIEQLVRLNIELEQEVTHCQKHHLPPPTPSKSKDLEVPTSLFNSDTNRASVSTATQKSTHIPTFSSNGSLPAISPGKSPKPSLPSANKHFNPTQVPDALSAASRRSGGRQTNWKPFPSSSNNSSPKSVTAVASPVAKLPSAAGSPYARPLNPTYNATPPTVYIPLTVEALSAAASPSPASKTGANLPEKRHFTPLGYISPSEPNKSDLINDFQRPKSKNGCPGPLRSHSSTPSLHLRSPLSPYDFVPYTPPMPAMMGGGLAVPFSPPTEDVQVVWQEHTLRKKLGELGNGLSDLFRAKE